MAAGIRSGVYRDILSRWDLSSMIMGVIFKAGLPQSAGKGYLNWS